MQNKKKTVESRVITNKMKGIAAVSDVDVL